MAKLHYYKFNIADWNNATSHLSLVEEAIYFRLINYYYDKQEPIPLETQSVYRRLRIGNDSVIADAILSEFFVKTDAGRTHSKCDELISQYEQGLSAEDIKLLNEAHDRHQAYWNDIIPPAKEGDKISFTE